MCIYIYIYIYTYIYIYIYTSDSCDSYAKVTLEKPNPKPYTLHFSPPSTLNPEPKPLNLNPTQVIHVPRSLSKIGRNMDERQHIRRQIPIRSPSSTSNARQHITTDCDTQIPIGSSPSSNTLQHTATHRNTQIPIGSSSSTSNTSRFVVDSTA